MKGIQIASLVQELRRFCWMGGFCLLVELHRQRSAPAACTAGLPYLHIFKTFNFSNIIQVWCQMSQQIYTRVWKPSVGTRTLKVSKKSRSHDHATTQIFLTLRKVLRFACASLKFRHLNIFCSFILHVSHILSEF